MASVEVPPDDEIFAAETEQRDLKTKWAEMVGPHGQPAGHSKVSVLMLYWNPDEKYTDFNVEDEVHGLRAVLQNKYRFNVSTERLDTGTMPQHQALKHVSHFVDQQDADDGLLIVYYAGHGGADKSAPGHITLNGKYLNDDVKRRDHSIEWADVETALKYTKSDILQIFDCCFAGLLCYPLTRSSTRCYEVLAACGQTQMTPAYGDSSFTRALIWAFDQLYSAKGFYTEALLTKIKDAPNFGKDQDPQICGNRLETHGEFLYITPMPESGKRKLNATRQELNEKSKHEELLDLRLHFHKKVTDRDLREVAKMFRSHLRKKAFNAHRVSALGKYSIKTHEMLRDNRMRQTVKRWTDWTRRKSGVAHDAEGEHVVTEAQPDQSVLARIPVTLAATVRLETPPQSSPEASSAPGSAIE